MRYRKEIDGLRALAVVPVILFHAGFQTFSGGFVGVDVFFVISGFLITSIIVNEQAKATFSLLRFYERRARRILPALLFMMLVTLPLAWLWLLPDAMKAFMQSVAAVPVFVSNFLFFAKTGYFDTGAEFKPLLHTWSLAVEEQYYLAFPLLMRLLYPRGRVATAAVFAAIGMASLALAHITAIAHPGFAFFLLPTRFWELLLGAGLALLGSAEATATSRHRVLAEAGATLGLGLIAYAMFAFNRNTPFPGLYAVVPTLGAAFILRFGDQTTYVGKALGNRVLVGIGMISYSAYLWHQPLFALARHRSFAEPGQPLLVALCFLTFALAYLSWRFVETPFRRQGQISRRSVFALAVLGSTFFVGVGAAGHLAKGFPSRFNQDALNLAKAVDERPQVLPLCDPRINGRLTVDDACRVGTGKLVGELIGDSHAEAISGALGAALTLRGLALKDATFPGCSPLVNVRKVTGDDDSCFSFNHAVLDAVTHEADLNYVVVVARWTMALDGNGENLDNTGRNGNGFDNQEGGVEILARPQTLVMSSAGKSEADATQRRFVKQRQIDTISAYLHAHKKVILVYPIPEMGWDVPTHLAKLAAFGHGPLRDSDGSTSYDLYKRRNKAAIAILDAVPDDPNLVRIRPDKLFCDAFVKQRCAAHVKGSSLYFDDDHVSKFGASFIVREIMQNLQDT